MPTGLERRHNPGDLHFVTVSCFRRQPLLGTPHLRHLFYEILINTTTKYESPLEAYVIMPEHFHLLLAPPDAKTNSLVLQVLKQRFARALKKSAPEIFLNAEKKTAHPPPMPVWEPRSYDKNLSEENALWKTFTYIHHNPVKRGLVTRPEEWPWSSYRGFLAKAERRYNHEHPDPTLSR